MDVRGMLRYLEVAFRYLPLLTESEWWWLEREIEGIDAEDVVFIGLYVKFGARVIGVSERDIRRNAGTDPFGRCLRHRSVQSARGRWVRTRMPRSVEGPSSA